METRDVIEVTLAVLGGFGVFIAAAGYFMGQFRQGQNNRRKDDIEGKKGVLDLLQEQVDSLEEMVEKHKTEIVILQTQNNEKDKKIKEYMELIQNRNPEMLAFMKFITETAVASNAYMKDTGLMFTQLKSTLEKIEQHLINE